MCLSKKMGGLKSKKHITARGCEKSKKVQTQQGSQTTSQDSFRLEEKTRDVLSHCKRMASLLVPKLAKES